MRPRRRRSRRTAQQPPTQPGLHRQCGHRPATTPKDHAQRRPHIYLGQFVTCVYNPDKALCRRQLAAAGDQTMPDLANCRPLQCRNVALTAENLKALTNQLHQLDTHLARADLLAPYVAHRLTKQRRDLAALLDAASPSKDTL